MKKELLIGNTRYFSHDNLTLGDYSGAGSVGLANIRALIQAFLPNTYCGINYGAIDYRRGSPAVYNERSPSAKGVSTEFIKQHQLVTVYGDYGYRQVWLREDVADLWLSRLDDYPLLDDQKHSEVESEWELAAWRDWAKEDFLKLVPDYPLPEEVSLQALARDFEDSCLWECYCQARSDCNEYPVMEYSGAYIAVDRIGGKFVEKVLYLMIRRFQGDADVEPKLRKALLVAQGNDEIIDPYLYNALLRELDHYPNPNQMNMEL